MKIKLILIVKILFFSSFCAFGSSLPDNPESTNSSLNLPTLPPIDLESNNEGSNIDTAQQEISNQSKLPELPENTNSEKNSVQDDISPKSIVKKEKSWYQKIFSFFRKDEGHGVINQIEDDADTNHVDVNQVIDPKIELPKIDLVETKENDNEDSITKAENEVTNPTTQPEIQDLSIDQNVVETKRIDAIKSDDTNTDKEKLALTTQNPQEIKPEIELKLPEEKMAEVKAEEITEDVRLDETKQSSTIPELKLPEETKLPEEAKLNEINSPNVDQLEVKSAINEVKNEAGEANNNVSNQGTLNDNEINTPLDQNNSETPKNPKENEQKSEEKSELDVKNIENEQKSAEVEDKDEDIDFSKIALPQKNDDIKQNEPNTDSVNTTENVQDNIYKDDNSSVASNDEVKSQDQAENTNAQLPQQDNESVTKQYTSEIDNKQSVSVDKKEDITTLPQAPSVAPIADAVVNNPLPQINSTLDPKTTKQDNVKSKNNNKVTTSDLKKEEEVLNDQETLEFVDNEVKVLAVDDSVILGMLSEESYLDALDYADYIYKFNTNFNRIKRYINQEDVTTEIKQIRGKYILSNQVNFVSNPPISGELANDTIISMIKRNDIRLLSSLLIRNPRYIFEKDCINNNLLQISIHSNAYESAKLLLRYGIDFKCKNLYGMDSIDSAIYYQNPKIKNLMFIVSKNG